MNPDFDPYRIHGTRVVATVRLSARHELFQATSVGMSDQPLDFVCTGVNSVLGAFFTTTVDGKAWCFLEHSLNLDKERTECLPT